MLNKLPEFSSARIIVLGDVMLDRYWSGQAARISPEAPVPVVKVKTIEDRIGGAGNVALNIAKLGGKVTLIGVVGDELTASKKQSEAQAMLLLKHKVKEKYGAAKAPFLIFAQDLAIEEQQLKDMLNTLLRVSNTSKMSAPVKTNHISLLKKLYDQRQQQAHNLENLIQITNTLLM